MTTLEVMSVEPTDRHHYLYALWLSACDFSLRWSFLPAMILALNLLLSCLFVCCLSAKAARQTLGPQTRYHAACVAIEAAFSGANSSVFYSGAYEEGGAHLR